ncbi:uncharacterized protein LOC123917172 isoform X2 [Trifolium pratense]|uniref:uncharacterized protein LOC123917172 isoform X2 n=1 Tax=Trifolium pratense TaxID=57577 RepID=UPI001E691D71|nr:uncharacterized protein LOC123917172 isoform X2 [Trifolium pratense]
MDAIQAQAVSPLDHDEMEFEEYVMEDKWEEVIEMYKNDSRFHKIKLKGRGTALHVAINNGYVNYVERLVDAIVKHDDKSGLTLLNEKDATPLHLAAYRGFTSMCEYIIGKNGERNDFIQVRNSNGETPLFWAVLARQRKVFVYLHQFVQYDFNFAINYDGTTILHVAIMREMFDLANIILYCYPGLSYMKDKNDVTPLEVLATRTSAFNSGSTLLWWEKLLYYCIPVKVQDPKTKMESYNKGTKKDLATIKIIKNKHKYGGQLLKAFMKNPCQSYTGGEDPGVDEAAENFAKFIQKKRIDTLRDLQNTTKQETEENKKGEDSAIKDEKDTTFLAVAKSGIVEIMEELDSKVPINSDKKGLLLVAMKNIKKEILSTEKTDKNETAFLIAAKHGIVEMIRELHNQMKSVIHETNSNNENVLLLAVKNRQSHVVELLKRLLSTDIFHGLNVEVDNNGNTMLHLAACASIHNENTWRISGAAMQMMWDIKWYKYIKGLVPDHFSHRTNKEGKFPSEIFKEQHKELLHDSIDWLKDTAESCSVVAALIAGVSFATSGNVPGGNDSDTGKPALEEQPVFEGFAVSSLIGLYFSVTALIMFLSILTSRKRVEDFSGDLPKKLLLGLSSLFVSIVAMLVSFCAGHFFVLTDKYCKNNILFYLYISICLPVTFYAVVQFPLYIDLLKVIWKKVPPSSFKGVHL